MKLRIAIGKSRHDKRYVNKEISWQTLVDKLSNTHYTAETSADFLKAKKERQDEIKDIGGFVGGHLTGGRRLVGNVTSRSLLTFDADFASVDFWEQFCLQYSCEALVYSTHKHLPESPRLRLVIPLSREVFVDEYMAIMRQMAADIGINMFDHTSYQAHRLMYWPSTSKDAEFFFKVQEGERLNPDSILATYKDWQDISQWPIGDSEKKTYTNGLKKQGEPTEKPGLIGAFNRAYSIVAAVAKFLPDVYLETSSEDRLTYAAGSTAAGVIIYDDKFIFSHHSTDPCTSQLCSAFDMVRLHKFGLEDIDSEAPINKQPSYLRMCELVANDPIVKKQLGEDRLKNAKEAFAEFQPEAESLDWLEEMDIDRKGKYLLTINNVALILENDSIFKNNVAFDAFKQQAIFKRDMPWRKLLQRDLINDNDLANIENYIEKIYKLPCSGKLAKGLLIVLEKFSFHPIVEYLASLRWDKTERISTLLTDYLGADDNEYTRAVITKSLAACVARVMSPGTKFDNVLTLVGAEGQGKSALWDKLGGRWFSDTFNMHMLQSKEAYEQIQGVWIIEIGELAGMAKADVERVKGFVSARTDNYRSPYGRTTEQRARQCVFFASTNNDDFLKSQTGNRRFWPVQTFVSKPSKSVHDMPRYEVDQIWAEAFDKYASGEKLFLEQELLEKAKEVQEQFTERGVLVEQLENYLAKRVPENWYSLEAWEKIDFIENYDDSKEGLFERDKICKYEIWEVLMKAKEPLSERGWRPIKNALESLKGWSKNKEYARFGRSYPRHKGSYFKD
jgi:predicted P-loop ATPase